MKKTLCILSVIIMTCLLFDMNIYAAHVKPGEISISDYAGIIPDTAKEYIKSKNKLLFDKTKAEIIFVTTDSTDGLDTQKYASNLYGDWNLDSFGRANSVLFVISVNNNDYSFVKGKNISLAISDAKIYEFIVKDFEPYFGKKNYGEAAVRMYNSLAGWYENQYKNTDLSLTSDYSAYSSGTVTKDIEQQPGRLWIWITAAAVILILIIVFRIKRRIEFRIRQHERRILKKKFKIDIDKIVNS